MNIPNLEKLFKLGTKKGFTEQEIKVTSATDTQITIYKGEVDNINITQNSGLGYRGIVDEKAGYSYTELVNEDSWEFLVDNAYDNAKIIENDDKQFLFDGKGYGEYAMLPPSNKFNVSMEDRIEIVKRLEKRILELEPRISEVATAVYGENEGFYKIKNTHGVDLENSSSLIFLYAIAIVNDGDQSRQGMDMVIVDDFKKLDVDELAKKIIQNTVAQIGARPIPTGSKNIIFEYGAFAELFGGFIGQFSAESVQKNLSYFKDKLGKQIASPILSLADDPHLLGGILSVHFDGEGVPTRHKYIIKDGVLSTYLYNLKTAHKDGVKSTGNGAATYKSVVGISTFNLVIEAGKRSLDSMIKDFDEVVLIKSLEGLHSGLNPISGDFSLQASGYLYRNGEFIQPVDQITVAGNFFEVLMNLKEFANDKSNSINNQAFYTPSVYVGQLTISGE